MRSDLEERNRELAREIVVNSGNSFNTRVLRALRKAGWTVRISPYYSDSESGKPREVDLLAERAFHLRDSYTQPAMLYVRLFIECKYVNAPSVFWMHEQDRHATFALLENRFGLNRTTIYAHNHHYLRAAKIAKLFASGKATEPEREPIYRALNQSLNALIALRPFDPIARVSAPGTTFELVVNYPVIVCSTFDEFFAVDMEVENDTIRLKDEFLLEVNYAYAHPTNGRSIPEFFLIDIVPFDRLTAFLDQIAGDVDAMKIPTLERAKQKPPR